MPSFLRQKREKAVLEWEILGVEEGHPDGVYFVVVVNVFLEFCKNYGLFEVGKVSKAFLFVLLLFCFVGEVPRSFCYDLGRFRDGMDFVFEAQ